MRVVRIRRRRWDVLAICSDTGAVFALDGLRGQNGEKQMLALLRESVPIYGPQKENSTVCLPIKPVSRGLWEFRKQPRRGPKPRVLWFPDGERVIVCAHSFVKREKTPPGDIELALNRKDEYFATKPHEIEELD